MIQYLNNINEEYLDRLSYEASEDLPDLEELYKLKDEEEEYLRELEELLFEEEIFKC